MLPTGGALRFGILTHPGAQPGRGGGVLPAEWNAVAPGYFATMRIPLVRGRDFNASDTAAAERVLIVSEEAARRFWPGQDPIGKVVMQHPAVFRRGEANEPTSLRVVGVAGNVKVLSRDAARAQVYLPLQQQFVSNVTIAARTTDGRRVARELRDAVMSLNANLPILSSGTLEDAAMFALLPQRVSAAVSGALGIVGLLLVGMGIYGVTAYTVTHRTREIGIRLALGAQRRQIVRWVLRDATLLMALGCTIGVTMAILAQAVLTRVFSDFPAFDPAPFAAAMPLFAGIGLAASYVPVRRAMRVDPVGALRHD